MTAWPSIVVAGTEVYTLGDDHGGVQVQPKGGRSVPLFQLLWVLETPRICFFVICPEDDGVPLDLNEAYCLGIPRPSWELW